MFRIWCKKQKNEKEKRKKERKHVVALPVMGGRGPHWKFMEIGGLKENESRTNLYVTRIRKTKVMNHKKEGPRWTCKGKGTSAAIL